MAKWMAIHQSTASYSIVQHGGCSLCSHLTSSSKQAQILTENEMTMGLSFTQKLNVNNIPT